RPGSRGRSGPAAGGLADCDACPQRAGAGSRQAHRPAARPRAPAQRRRGRRGLAERRRQRIPGQLPAADTARKSRRAPGVGDVSQEAGAFDGAFEVLSAAEADRVTALYAPLADAVRELADATVRTEVDDDVVAEARIAIETATRLLRQRSRPVGVSYRVDGL